MTKKKPGYTIQEKLDLYSIPEPNTGCLLWLGALEANGYGCIWTDSKKRKAHVVSYELQNGPVPIGKELDHKCRVRCCIEPEHLEPVTRRENVMRGLLPSVTAARGRALTHCKHGHEFTRENTYITSKG